MLVYFGKRLNFYMQTNNKNKEIVMLNVLSKIFGTKNDRDLKRIRKIVDKINKFEPTISS